jgi:hypothetical protein
MNTTTDLLVILLYLSALYTVLGLFAAAAELLARMAAHRPWRLVPFVQRRPRRARPRRRSDRDLSGATRRPVAVGKSAGYAVRAANTIGKRSGNFSTWSTTA